MEIVFLKVWTTWEISGTSLLGILGIMNIQQISKKLVEPNKSIQFQLVNQLGMPIKSGKATENSIDVSEFSRGIYFLILNSRDDRIITEVIIKE